LGDPEGGKRDASFSPARGEEGGKPPFSAVEGRKRGEGCRIMKRGGGGEPGPSPSKRLRRGSIEKRREDRYLPSRRGKGGRGKSPSFS